MTTGRHGSAEQDPGQISEYTGLDQDALAHGLESQQCLTDISLWQEIEQNRKSEWWLLLFAILALTMVAGLVVVRELVFL